MADRRARVVIGADRVLPALSARGIDRIKDALLGDDVDIAAQVEHRPGLGLVVEREVPFAQVKGYKIAGKTGTAQIPIPGGYDDPWTIASFVGYGPADDPQLIILVKLDRPTLSPWTSRVTGCPAGASDAPPGCGNGIKEGIEVCDGTDFGGKTWPAATRRAISAAYSSETFPI